MKNITPTLNTQFGKKLEPTALRKYDGTEEDIQSPTIPDEDDIKRILALSL